MKRTSAGLISIGLFLGLGFLLAQGAEQEKSKDSKRPHDVFVGFQFPAVVINPDDTVSVDFVVKNRGSTDEIVRFEVIEQPTNWVAEIKRYGTTIKGLMIAADESQTLTFSARPKDKSIKRLPPGNYKFAVSSTWADQTVTSTLEVIVRSSEESGAKVELETSYPVLRGAADETFEFSLDVRNESDENAVFNFKATAPKGWEVSFSPAYERKQISSLEISSRSSRTVNVQVKPPYNVEAGEYPITVTVESSKAKGEKELRVIVTGTYKIEAFTPNHLLSYVTERGRTLNVTLLVQNRGSASQREITFSSFYPENWKVEFKPERLENLEPGTTKEVTVSITPARESLIGDYSVGIDVRGEKANDNLELRITVKAPTIWGWVGVLIIIVVIVGLAITFRALGRR